MNESAQYTGRFAPSPSGPLHFGSLLAACASYLQARAANGRWLLRIEDIDPPRSQPGASDEIIRALEIYGFQWDGQVIYQSTADERHRQALQQLLDAGQAYPCGCSRRDLETARRGPLGTVYPGTCRAGTNAAEYAVRVRTDNEPVCFDDRLQGRHCQALESESGDFVVLRRDGLVAYHLAVVVDDADQNISEVVRGVDLLDSTPRHIHLQRLLGLPTPRYLHIPVAVHPDGQKLSKLTGAAALPFDDPRPLLIRAFKALELGAPVGLADGTVSDLWQWAIANWDVTRLRGQVQIPGHTDSMATH
jgi:glutamyl-Q tRNA(Asp) synthetase